MPIKKNPPTNVPNPGLWGAPPSIIKREKDARRQQNLQIKTEKNQPQSVKTRNADEFEKNMAKLKAERGYWVKG